MDIRERLLRLRADEIAEEEANDALMKLAAQAARLYRRYISEGKNGLERDLVPGFTAIAEFGFESEDGWCVAWHNILIHLAANHPGRLAGPESIGDAELPAMRAGGFSIIFAKNRWRQRAEDYAAACALLAELTGERVTVTIADAPSDGLTVTEVSQITGRNSGSISRMCDEWTSSRGARGLKHNGQKGSRRRIDPSAVLALQLRQAREGCVMVIRNRRGKQAR